MTHVFQGSRLPLPQPLPSSSPHPYPDPPAGRGGPPGPSRPSPGTPGRPTRPEPPGYRPGVPCRPGLAYSRQRDGMCGRGSAGQSPALPGTGNWPPHSALHHPPAVPFPPSTLTLQVLFRSYISAKQAEGQDLDQSAPCLSITLQLGEEGRRDMQTAPGTASRGHS